MDRTAMIPSQIPPWERMTRTLNRPIPRRMNAARNPKRRAKCAKRHDKETETPAGGTRIYYTDGACAEDNGKIRAATAWNSPSTGITEVKLLGGKKISNT